ncbi:uncharacterized protein BT62DRAFT_1025760 [Guyanagaster necrorhizus]|uniref:Uncharacterized protein n=1 Tax=Guyanagaster necrorhizus TaxID=856835 RepID=A0A9P8ARK4_9AGAR|nr:uncharacterized protein BT62DRAFT_1025760 [Guyanagaster necrorhizus MCA 3950]KAG7445190.1 hypothetical protein BT62DRAFT_1025760 [Guyanagaster necrorhizus MCA 3950]
MSKGLDADLNSMILYSLLNGIYTGIVAVALWNIYLALLDSLGPAMAHCFASCIFSGFCNYILYSSFALASILWCTLLIIYYIITVAQAGNEVGEYFDILAAIARGIAPTLLVGQVAAGHAHPDDSWQGSTISSSLHFGTHSGDHDSQQDSIMNGDLEAQQMIDDEYGHHTAVDSQEDIGINSSEGIIHRDYNGLEVLEIQV